MPKERQQNTCRATSSAMTPFRLQLPRKTGHQVDGPQLSLPQPGKLGQRPCPTFKKIEQAKKRPVFPFPSARQPARDRPSGKGYELQRVAIHLCLSGQRSCTGRFDLRDSLTARPLPNNTPRRSRTIPAQQRAAFQKSLSEAAKHIRWCC